MIGRSLLRKLTTVNRSKNVRSVSNKTIDQAIVKPTEKDSHKFCLAHVRKYDRENYLAGLCIRDDISRRAMFALRAFNVELSLVRDSTTNTDRAKVRFHFWSKLIEEIIRRNDEADSNVNKLIAYYNYTPVAKELLELFHLVDLDEDIKKWLNDLIGARVSSKVLGYKPFDDMKDLELYCEKSNSSLYHLSYTMAFQLHSVWHVNYNILPHIKAVAHNLGIAHGLSNVIRGIPYNSTKNCCYVPKDILEQYNLTSRDFVNKRLNGEKIAPVVKSLAARCQELIDKVYHNQKFMPNHFRDLFLARICIQASLSRLQKCNYNICDPSLARPNGLLPLSLWLGSKYFRLSIF